VKPRIVPVPVDEWPDEVLSAIPAIDGSPRTGLPPGSEAAQRGRNALGVLAHHPDLATSWMQFTAHILRHSTLSDRQRELLILRVAVVRKSQYQWVEHVPIARRSGLDDGEIARVAFGPDAPFWTPLERALLRSADELLADGGISEPTWGVLAAEFEPKQLLDLVFTVGAYETNCLMARSCRLQPDESLSGATG
jgi:alkylhydroperoxidase family enzyme